MLEVLADGIKDFSLSEDGTSARFSLTTSYTSDIVVTLPAECLNALQTAIQLSAPAPGPGSQMPVAEQPTGSTVIKVPKNWSAAVDKQHGVVVVLLDRDTPGQSAFALHPDAATKLAAALVKQADVVAANAAAKPDQPFRRS